MSRAQLREESAASAYHVEVMTEHDLVEVVEIEESCGLSLWGWDAYRAELDRPEAIMLVARNESNFIREEGTLDGFIAARLSADELHINNIGVREASRRVGLGSALLGAALAWAASKGARAAYLEVRAANHAAQSLYHRHGFRAAGGRKNYYKHPSDDALIMVARINSSA